MTARKAARNESSSTGVLQWLVPSLGSVLALVALSNALFFRRHHMFRWDGDVGRHIRVGRTILETGRIPNVDLWSHTRAGQPFVPYEWLSETLTALTDAYFGLPGILVMTGVLYAIAIVATYRSASVLGTPRVLAFLIGVLAVLVTSVHLMPRPHLFTTALAAVFLVILLRHAKSSRRWDLAPLPPLMLFWVNTHGGFLIGFIVLGVFLLGALLRSAEFEAPRQAAAQIAGVTLICGVASLLNPAGVQLWAHTTGYLGIDFLVGATQEYQSVDFHTGFGKLFFVCVFAGPALWATGLVRITWVAAGMYGFFTAASLHSARNAPLWAVLVLPWLAIWIRDALSSLPAEWSRSFLRRAYVWDSLDRQLRPAFGVAAAMLLVWLAVGPSAEPVRFDPAEFPVGALDQLGRALPGERVFNQMGYGGYLLYARDDIPVFIDGQTDFYGEELSRDYLRILKGRQGWRETLAQHDVDWTLTHSAEPINRLLDLDPGWELVLSAEPALVFRRVKD